MESKQRGSVTVEAAIVFPIFIIAIFSLIMLIKFAFIHTVMQQGLSQMSKELATYSYLLEASRLTEVDSSLTGALGSNVEALEQQIETGKDWLNTMQGYFEGENSKEDVKTASGSAMDMMQEIISNPAQLMKNIGSVAALGLYEDGKSLILENMTRFMLPYCTGMEAAQLNELFILLGIENGLKGVEIKYQSNKDHTIELVAAYAVNLDPPLNIFLDEITLVQRAAAVAWTGDDSSYKPKK